MVGVDRGFQELSAVRLGHQTAAQRFGDHRTLHNPPLDESDSENELDVEDDEASMPRIEEWRMNLTALSQYHNLYFVAYGDQVYVYRPRGPQQCLPAEPGLILDPPQSRQAVRNYSGLLNKYHAHVINHLLTGDLGNKEIVLFACHDGDVLAYYTDAIEAAFLSTPTGHSNVIRPFFAENVGSSAWGLAIHTQSRLIAVASNAREVQVFAFALSTSSPDRLHGRIRSRRHEIYGMRTERFPVMKKNIYRTADGLIPRKLNFRRILKLNLRGDNIPSVAFGDDMYGEAETVVAKDIKGALWFLHIWNGTWQRLATVPEEPNPHRNPAGWGVMVLPRNFFKPTWNHAEAFGCPKSMVSTLHRENRIDITETVPLVKDYSMWHNRLAIFGINLTELDDEGDGNLQDEDEDDEDENRDDGDDDEGEDNDGSSSNESNMEEVIESLSPLYAAETSLDIEANLESYPDSHAHELEGMNLDPPQEMSQLATSPSSQDQFPSPTLSSPPNLTDQPYLTTTRTPAHLVCHNEPLLPKEALTNRSITSLMPNGACILHTNRHSFTLLPTTAGSPPTHCHNALRQELPHDAWFLRPLSEYDRLNMLLRIPELSLILIASQVGRVALCTVTRPVDRRSAHLTPIVSMRLELVLPLKSEETAKLRPNFGLLGMAVSPVWGERDGRRRRRALGPRRWRLMLHYFNHAILSYEIWREADGDGLAVV